MVSVWIARPLRINKASSSASNGDKGNWGFRERRVGCLEEVAWGLGGWTAKNSNQEHDPFSGCRRSQVDPKPLGSSACLASF